MFNRQGFMQALNDIQRLPRTEWLDFVKSKYEKAQDGTFNDKLNQAKQMMSSNNPYIQNFASTMGQFGIRF